MPDYTIASQEGAARYGGEVGDTVSLVLQPEEEQAVICAGWITKSKRKET